MSELTVSNYLEYFFRQNQYRQRYENLFNGESLRRLRNVREQYGERVTPETILEIRLSETSRDCDYSFMVEVDSPLVSEYWYELDFDVCKEGEIAPCCFVDASAVKAGADNSVFYDTVLLRLAGKERLSKLRPMLERCVRKLQGKCECLFQLGVMEGRGQGDSIRLFTNDLLPDALTEFLRSLDWTGDTEALRRFLQIWENYSDQGRFILDFDVYEDHISEKIGINFGTGSKELQVIERLLSKLEEEGFCLPSKREGVMEFVSSFPSHTPFIQNDISHFKLPFQGKAPLSAKVYLRQGNRCFFRNFKAFETPALMNLELTTLCPLRCPQCYCDLTKGKEMKLQEALYWIDQAADCNVRTVNLSGGETLCYPHLYQVIAACRSRNMEPNIAISGWNFDRLTLKRLKESGAADICVSLNGSTEEINEKSRQGYHLAVNALELLRLDRYPRTCINWVMHSFNAEDFPRMLELAKQYQVRSLVVMVFKPDADSQLPSVPSETQVRQVADWIREYRSRERGCGPVIEVEECFSQMRALLGQRFFTNLNRGVSRGCGAGRDGVSVSVDGRLTPCRHLELPEETRSIREYWMESRVLGRLREVEEEPGIPCRECRYMRYCLPCMAVNWKQKGMLSMGDETCPLAPDRGHEEERLILVDLDDCPVGEAGKLEVHQKGLLHRAFSVFLYHEGKMLIQQRAEGKYHSAGLWANTCCSHPRAGETLEQAVRRRLAEEAGIVCKVEHLDSFVYREVFGELSEYELDHVFVGDYGGDFIRNPLEAQEMKYVDMKELAADIRVRPQRYAAWFLTAFPMVYRYWKEGTGKTVE